jgi:hypothetical protein
MSFELYRWLLMVRYLRERSRVESTDCGQLTEWYWA